MKQGKDDKYTSKTSNYQFSLVTAVATNYLYTPYRTGVLLQITVGP